MLRVIEGKKFKLLKTVRTDSMKRKLYLKKKSGFRKSGEDGIIPAHNYKAVQAQKLKDGFVYVLLRKQYVENRNKSNFHRGTQVNKITRDQSSKVLHVRIKSIKKCSLKGAY